MSFVQLSQKLRQVRSQMPRVNSEKAYAQMDRLLAAQKTSTAPKQRDDSSKHGHVSGT
jgi:hypothetical protein